MLHRAFIFIGGIVAMAIFGSHWGVSARNATGVIGALLGLAAASGIDEPVPFAVIRWGFLVSGAAATGFGFGWVFDHFSGSAGQAPVPCAIIGGLVGVALCGGVKPEG
jgi:hypothetical protein